MARKRQRLAERRRAVGLSQEQLAEAVGVDRSTVVRWERADTDPQPWHRPRLASAIRVTIEELGDLLADTREVPGNAIPRELENCNPAIDQALSWLDEHAGWQPGDARERVGKLLTIDTQQLRDRASLRRQVTREEIAGALADYYQPWIDGFHPYGVLCMGKTTSTSILTRPEWLDLRIPLGNGGAEARLDWTTEVINGLDERGADAAALRLAEALVNGTRIVNTPIYRLLDISFSGNSVQATLALTDFVRYALTMDLLENELIAALSQHRPVRHGTLELRDRYLPTAGSVVSIGQRLCAGGTLALFAAARPAGRTRKHGDYVLLVQERSGRVLNAPGRLAVIPKSFHEPLGDLSGDAYFSATLERELEEELFGRVEVDSTRAKRKHADPLHPSRLSPPMLWLTENAGPAAWLMECTGFGLNLVSGNFEFASLIVIHDETWWCEFGGYVEANWESDGLRRYSTLDTDALAHLIQDGSWSNEGLFAFLQGVRRLTEIGGDRVRIPAIELEV